MAEMSLQDIISDFKWPGHELIGFTYPKTATCLFYASPEDKEPLFGWKALHASVTTKGAAAWQFQRRFKLHLADKPVSGLPPLPPGKTAIAVIADFLRLMNKFILESINKSQRDMTSRDIKYCLTIPAQWSQKARATMHHAAELAGMIRGADGTDNGGSIHPLSLVLEPEAAAVYALNKSVVGEAARELCVLACTSHV